MLVVKYLHPLLVGGFNPSEKHSSNWIISPRSGVNIKNIWNHHLDLMSLYWASDMSKTCSVFNRRYLQRKNSPDKTLSLSGSNTFRKIVGVSNTTDTTWIPLKLCLLDAWKIYRNYSPKSWLNGGLPWKKVENHPKQIQVSPVSVQIAQNPARVPICLHSNCMPAI